MVLTAPLSYGLASHDMGRGHDLSVLFAGLWPEETSRNLT